MATEIFKGEKYDANIMAVEIAKRLRSEVKEAVKSGKLPAGTKVRITTDRSSLHESINMTVTATSIKILSREAIDLFLREGSTGSVYRHTEEARALLTTLNKMMGAYLYSETDGLSDYSNKNFYGHAKFDWQLEDADRATAEQEVRAGWLTGDVVNDATEASTECDWLAACPVSVAGL